MTLLYPAMILVFDLLKCFSDDLVLSSNDSCIDSPITGITSLKKTTKYTLEGQRHESLLDKTRSSLKHFRRSKTTAMIRVFDLLMCFLR
jgi:hypothetical protein